MIKSDLISKLASKMAEKSSDGSETSLSEKEIANAVNKILDYLGDALGEGQRVEIRGFGSFSLRYRPERNAHNPKTGAKVVTKAKHTPHFKPGKELRERVDNSKSLYPIKVDKSEEDGD